MYTYGHHNKLITTPGHRNELANILCEASAMMLAQDTCGLYLVSLDQDDPDVIWVTEAWSSEEAHQQSLQMPAVKALISKAMPLIAQPPQKTCSLEIVAGL